MKQWRYLMILVCLLSIDLIGKGRTQHSYTFADYVKAGLKFHCTIAIDLSASRPDGNPRHPSTAPSNSSYETVLSLLVDTLEPLIYVEKFFVFGFGAELSSLPDNEFRTTPGKSDAATDDFCFNNDLLTNGVQGVLEVYRKCVSRSKVSKTANFAPVIRRVMDMAHYRDSLEEKYFILVILTDGTITDMQETIETIIEASITKPISIMIAGVGSKKFDDMVFLDADFTRFEANGKKALRDIVHFVPFNGEVITPEMAKEVLAELPSQVVYFMRSHANEIEPKFKTIDRGVQTTRSVASSMIPDIATTEKIQKVMQQAIEKGTFYGNLDSLQIVSGGNGKLVAEMVIQPKHVNLYGTLHGGCTATIVDICTGIALGTHPTPGTGVSIDIHVSYLNPGKLNDTIVIEADTIKVGRTLAFAEATIRSKSTGAVIAKGSHTKYVDNTSGKFSILDFSN